MQLAQSEAFGGVPRKTPTSSFLDQPHNNVLFYCTSLSTSSCVICSADVLKAKLSGSFKMLYAFVHCARRPNPASRHDLFVHWPLAVLALVRENEVADLDLSCAKLLRTASAVHRRSLNSAFVEFGAHCNPVSSHCRPIQVCDYSAAASAKCRRQE